MANASQTLCLSTDTADGAPCRNLVAHFTYQCAAGHIPATRHFPSEPTKAPVALVGAMTQGTIDFDELGYGEGADTFGERTPLATENWPYNATAYVLSTDERTAACTATKQAYRAMETDELETELVRVKAELDRLFDVVKANSPEMISGLGAMSDDVPQEIRALKEEMLSRRSILWHEIDEKKRQAANAKRMAEYVAATTARQEARAAEMRALIEPMTSEELAKILDETRSAEMSYQYRDATMPWETNLLFDLREKSAYAKEELQRRGITVP